MKRIAWLDPVGGIAGDMVVAALLDAGADEAAVVEAVRGLNVDGWSATSERVWRGPFHARRFVVSLDAGDGAPTGVAPGAATKGEAVLGAHSHDHDHGHAHDHGHRHDHGPPASIPMARSRRWTDIRALLEAAPLAPRVRSRAIATFSALAEAEGRVHGLPPEHVTFHEVGAVDSIVDIVAACVALELLKIDELFVGRIPLGHGHTLGEHGWIPLPAPATVELLRGFEVEGREIRGETVTPTGAALLAALARPGKLPAMRVVATGVGAGSWDPASHPNVLRLLIGEGEAGSLTDVIEIRCEVDSLHPEAVPALMDALFAAGALEANVAPIVMKKGRPAFRVTVVVSEALRAPVGEVLLRHGRSLGYRYTRMQREVLARRIERVRTTWGDVGVKIGERDGVPIHAAPEYDECAAIAIEAGVPVSDVIAAALASWSSRRT